MVDKCLFIEICLLYIFMLDVLICLIHVYTCTCACVIISIHVFGDMYNIEVTMYSLHISFYIVCERTSDNYSNEQVNIIVVFISHVLSQF